MGSGSPVGLLLGALVAFGCLLTQGGRTVAQSMDVTGTSFRLTLPDGRVFRSPDLIGAILDVEDDDGRSLTVRLDAVTRDPSDRDGDVWLHHFSAWDTVADSWRDLCITPGPDGTVGGFPVAGRWTSDGRHLSDPTGFLVTCTAGAIGKCVRLGYKPWRNAGEVASLWDYHQACVRMMRADYGGDGVSHTRDGTFIDIFDRLGIQHFDPEDPRARALEDEAAWGPDGAVCIRRTRIPELLSLDELARRYPHLAGKIGPNCSEAVDALIWNRS
jgi:ADYC domain